MVSRADGTGDKQEQEQAEHALNGIQGEKLKNPSLHTQRTMFLQGKKEPKKEKICLPV